MSREFDIVVFGATGVTGRYAVEQVHLASKEDSLTYAVAGRNEDKLIQALKEVAEWLGEDGESFARSVPKIIADINDKESLARMARRARIVVNTVGPYRLYGEPVIEACVAEGTHQVDVSGEPQYIESMRLKYHKDALDKKIYLVSACGFDSIPCELLVNYAKENFHGLLHSVETFVSFGNPKKATLNTGTWNSLVNGISSWSELPSLRRRTKQEIFPKECSASKFPLANRFFVSTSPLVRGFIVPFLGADRSIVITSEMFRNEINETGKFSPLQIRTYMGLPNALALMGVSLIGLMLVLLARFSFGRRLLMNHPSFFSFGLFSKIAPQREHLLPKTMTYTLHGKGWEKDDNQEFDPTKEIVCEMRGPDPAYIGTSIMLVQSAISILKDSGVMPFSGGCLSPGFAFEKTTLRRRLEDHGFKFSLIRQ